MRLTRWSVWLPLAALLTSGLPASESPYAGMEERPIKALSPEEIEGYLNGRGMGFAMAAELNGYPGPKHVLELENELGLTAEQLAATRAAFDRMHVEAVRLGSELVERERELDALFAEHRASAGDLESLTAEIGRLRGRLRATHLEAHLQMVEVLSPEQRHLYVEARGYQPREMQHDPRRHGH